MAGKFRTELTDSEQRAVDALFEANGHMSRSDWEAYVNAKGNLIVRMLVSSTPHDPNAPYIMVNCDGTVRAFTDGVTLSPQTRMSQQRRGDATLRESRRVRKAELLAQREEQRCKAQEEAHRRWLASYFGQHQGDSFPEEVIRLVRKSMGRKAFLKPWQRPLVATVRLDVSDDRTTLSVAYDMHGKSRSVIQFSPQVITRSYDATQRTRIDSFEAEAKAIEKRIIEAAYEVTESGRKRVTAACKKAVRTLVKDIALPRALHEYDNEGYDQSGHDLLDDLLKQDVSIEDGPRTAAGYGHVGRGRRSDFRQAYLVLCRIGRFRTYYDLRDGNVLMNEYDEGDVREYAHGKRYAKRRRQVLDACGQVLGQDSITSSLVDQTTLVVSVDRAVRNEMSFDLETVGIRDVRLRCQGVLDEEGMILQSYEQECLQSGLVGRILPLEIIKFLVANHGTDSAEYITPNVIAKEVKGNAIGIWSGVRYTDLSGRMGAFTHDEIGSAYAALRQAGFVSVTKKEWDEGYYDNVKPVMPKAQTLIDLAYRPAAPGTPVDGMTEWQLLSLLDGFEGRDEGRLAEELPILLDHPACYYAEPQRFGTYARALPDYLKDYVRLAYKMSTDRTQRKMFRAVIADMGK